MEIPQEFLPDRNQVPRFVTNDAELERFQLCFALTRMLIGRDDVVFTRQLYSSDIATGDLKGLPDVTPEESGESA